MHAEKLAAQNRDWRQRRRIFGAPLCICILDRVQQRSAGVLHIMHEKKWTIHAFWNQIGLESDVGRLSHTRPFFMDVTAHLFNINIHELTTRYGVFDDLVVLRSPAPSGFDHWTQGKMHACKHVHTCKKNMHAYTAHQLSSQLIPKILFFQHPFGHSAGDFFRRLFFRNPLLDRHFHHIEIATSFQKDLFEIIPWKERCCPHFWSMHAWVRNEGCIGKLLEEKYAYEFFFDQVTIFCRAIVHLTDLFWRFAQVGAIPSNPQS